MKDHHNINYPPKRIWVTPGQIKQLEALGYPKSVAAEMNYKEAEKAIGVGVQLSEGVKDWEARYELPELMAVSGPQTVFARNCRYGYLKQVAGVYALLEDSQRALFMQSLVRLKQVTAAQYWIDKR